MAFALVDTLTTLTSLTIRMRMVRVVRVVRVSLRENARIGKGGLHIRRIK